MTKLHLRRRAILAGAPALIAAPYVARAQTGKPEKSKVVLAVGGKSALYYLSLTIAERKGFFKEAGLDVEINDFQGGAKSLEALMGGSADVVAGAYEHTIRMQQRGQPIKGFALIGRGMQLAIGLRNDVAAKIKGPADIKGMKFGVTAPGSQTQMLVTNWAPPGYLLGDQAIYEKAFANVRETISPDGIMPPDGPANCLKFLAEGDPKIEPAKIKLGETWTNEFAQRAKKHS